MAALVCTNCGFRMEAEKAKKCPYCNSEKLEKEKSAEELLENLEE